MVKADINYIVKGVGSKMQLFLAKGGTAGGNNMCYSRSPWNIHVATSVIFVWPMTAALSS